MVLILNIFVQLYTWLNNDDHSTDIMYTKQKFIDIF